MEEDNQQPKQIVDVQALDIKALKGVQP